MYPTPPGDPLALTPLVLPANPNTHACAHLPIVSMWHSAPFLALQRGGFLGIIPGFTMIVAYLAGGAVLVGLVFVFVAKPTNVASLGEDELARSCGACTGIFTRGLRRCTPVHPRPAPPRNMDQRLEKLYTLCVRWLAGYSVLVLVVHLPAYSTGANYYECGDPLLRTTSAYLAESPTQGCIAVAGMLATAVLGVLFVSQIGDLVGDVGEEDGGGGDGDGGDGGDGDGNADSNSGGGNGDVHTAAMARFEPNNDRALAWLSVDAPSLDTRALRAVVATSSPWVRFAWFNLWMFSALALCVPAIIYALSTIMPAKEGSLNESILNQVGYNAPVLITLVSSLAVPQVARWGARKAGLPSSWLLLTSRLMTTWLVPFWVVLILDNSCSQQWVKFWHMCDNGLARTKTMDILGPDGSWFITGYDYANPLNMTNSTTTYHPPMGYLEHVIMVNASKEICITGQSLTGWGDESMYTKRTNQPQCARAVIAALAPLLLKKMAIAALALPAITLLKWRILPTGAWACFTCRKSAPLDSTINLDDIVAQLLAW